MKRHWLLAVALIICGSGVALGQGASAPAWPQGMYGNVFLSAETGDLGGFEVRFYEADGRRMAEFVLCEGWCNEAFHAEVVRDGNGFLVEHVERQITSEGIEQLHQVRYLLTPVAGGLRLEGWFDGARRQWDAGEALPRIERPFGLNVANQIP